MNIKHITAKLDEQQVTWICARCTNRDAVNNHMCYDCEQEHNKWLRELSEQRIELEGDDWYTLYESRDKR